MADLLLDTDIFIDHLRGARKLAPGGSRVSYSVVTRCELFAGAGADEDGIRLLLGPFHEVPVDRPVAELAGRLRRGREMRTPDALIAATALRSGLTLVTRNARHFRDVPRLRVRDEV